jgi:hypothetical protein
VSPGKSGTETMPAWKITTNSRNISFSGVSFQHDANDCLNGSRRHQKTENQGI